MRSSLMFVTTLALFLGAGRLAAADDKKLDDIAPPKEISGKDLKQWVAEIKDPDPGVIENAIRTVVHFGTDARAAGPNLISRLDHADSSIRTNAAVALGLLNKELHTSDIPKAVEKLGDRMIDDTQSVVRLHCALALSKFGEDAKPALAKLISGSQDPKCWEVRKASVIALGAVAPDKKNGADPHVFAALRDVLVKDRCAKVRLEAVVAVAMLGRPAAKADAVDLLKILEAKFTDHDKAVVIWARVAYMAVDEISEAQLKEIAKFLKAPDVAVKGYAIKALSSIGAKAETYIPDLIALLRDKEPIVAAAAVTALTQMDKDNQEDKKVPKITARLRKDVVPIINDRLKEKDLDEGLKRTLKAALDLFMDKPAENAGK